MTFGVPVYITDIILTLLVAGITLGGLKSIARAASAIVPFMAVLYFVTCLGIILLHISDVPAAVALIIDSAFNGHAAVGGFAGSTIMMAMKMVSHVVYSPTNPVLVLHQSQLLPQNTLAC